MSNTVHSIEIRNLWKKYDFFWENLNPDVNILIGINGSGKTTLFNIIDSIMMADVKRLRIYGVGVKITIDDYTVDFQQKMTAGELKTALRNVKYQKYQSSDLYRRWRSDTALQTIIRGKAVVADSDACIPDGRTALHPLDGRT